MSYNPIATGKRISSIRKAKGITQVELSRMINCSPVYLSNLENGTKNISICLLMDLVDALEVSPNDLLHDSVKKAQPVYLEKILECLADCDENELITCLNMIRTLTISLKHNKINNARTHLTKKEDV